MERQEKPVSELEFRPFDENDWQMYQGAECDSGSPLVCHTTGKLNGVAHELIIVLDDNGINLDYSIPEGHELAGTWLHDLYFEVEGGIGAATAAFNVLDLRDATLIGLKALGFVYNDLGGKNG